eukprot:TRINITY_DN4885_c0_g1_i1.p1 TRINITY_DN4885_c0_g1~~TRINITY_DN4885_c0_g1_i1.p1  ORF type:complete len:359 (-),score=53.30 TRINITY_DN4885_c0_g1_i1:184-1260(-)
MAKVFSTQVYSAVNQKSLGSVNSNGCKLAVKDEHNYFCAFGPELYHTLISLPQPNSDLTPAQGTLVSNKQLINHSHSNNIENVVFRSQNGLEYLYTIDSLGVANVSVSSSDGCNYKLQPSSTPNALGWCGIAVHDDPIKVATTSFFGKWVLEYEGDKVVRQRKVSQFPNQIGYIPTHNLLTVVEYNHLSFWDERQATPARRLFLPSTQPLHAMSCTKDLVAVGGESRMITFFDTKTWTVRDHWKNCVKTEVTSVNFSYADPEYCYVSDDSVVVCDLWSSTLKKNAHSYFSKGIRLESRSLGVSVQNTDVVGVLTENGKLYTIQNATFGREKTELTPKSKKAKTTTTTTAASEDKNNNN